MKDKKEIPACHHRLGLEKITNIEKSTHHNYNINRIENQEITSCIREGDTCKRVDFTCAGGDFFILELEKFYNDNDVDLNYSDTSRKSTSTDSRRMRLIRRLSNYLIAHRREYKMRFITLTYAENVSIDSKDTISNFIKKLNYKGLHVHGYFWTSEFQKRGALHYHIVVLFDVKDDVRVEYIRDAWKKGRIDVKTVDMNNTNNLVFYLAKYMLKACNVRQSKKRSYGRGGVLRTEINISESSIDRIMRYANFKKSWKNRKGLNYYYDDDNNVFIVAYGQGGIKHIAYIERDNMLRGRNLSLESPDFYRFLSRKMFNVYLEYKRLEKEFYKGTSQGMYKYYFNGEHWIEIGVSQDDAYYEIETDN